jgi:hypothetical protein
MIAVPPAKLAQVVVVTLYYREDRSLPERCIDSVQRQTVPTDHLLVADGHPQDWIDRAGMRRLRLDREHRDFGNTPRGVGAVLAAAEGYSGISLLDADNRLEPDHVEACLAAAARVQGAPCDFVVTRRNFAGPDGARIDAADEPPDAHVDTNCFFFLDGAFHTLPAWVLMPSIDAGPSLAWLKGLDDRGLEIVSRQLGSKLERGT